MQNMGRKRRHVAKHGKPPRANADLSAMSPEDAKEHRKRQNREAQQRLRAKQDRPAAEVDEATEVADLNRLIADLG